MFNITDIDHEEVVKTSDCGWRQGRRVVELGVLADALKACMECGMTCCKYSDLWTFSNTKGKLYLLIKVANFFFSTCFHQFQPLFIL